MRLYGGIDPLRKARLVKPRFMPRAPPFLLGLLASSPPSREETFLDDNSSSLLFILSELPTDPSVFYFFKGVTPDLFLSGILRVVGVIRLEMGAAPIATPPCDTLMGFVDININLL